MSQHRFRDYWRALGPLIDITSALPVIAVSFAISFIRDLAIASHLSDSPLANAYSIVAAVQAILVSIAIGTINASLPPEFAKNPAHQRALMRASFFRAFRASVLISAACLAGSAALLSRSNFTSHLSITDLAAGAILFSLSIPVQTLGAVVGVRLNSQRRLLMAALPTIGAAAGVLMAAQLNIPSLTLLGSGLVLGAASGLALAALAVSRCTYTTRQQSLDAATSSAAFRNVPHTAIAATLSSAATFLDSFILATLLPNSVAIYAYASRVPIGLNAIVSAVSSARIIHIFSELLSQRGVPATFRRCLALYVLTICASTIVAIVFSAGSMGVVRILFERGRFGSQLAATVAHIQAVLIWYLPPALASQILNQFLWAIGRNRMLMWMSATMLLLKLTIGAPAAHLFGIAGLAWSQVGIYWLIAIANLLLATRYSRRGRSAVPA